MLRECCGDSVVHPGLHSTISPLNPLADPCSHPAETGVGDG